MLAEIQAIICLGIFCIASCAEQTPGGIPIIPPPDSFSLLIPEGAYEIPMDKVINNLRITFQDETESLQLQHFQSTDSLAWPLIKDHYDKNLSQGFDPIDNFPQKIRGADIAAWENTDFIYVIAYIEAAAPLPEGSLNILLIATARFKTD